MATVLIVDDRTANRDFLATLLAYGGHRVLPAADGAEALVIIAREHPDLVIADVLMPTMDGYELVRQIRADPRIAETPVIFWTAHYHEREARALAAKCGASAVIIKPSESEEVLRAIETALRVLPSTAAPDPVADFDSEHLRLITGKLSQKADDLRSTNERLSALIELNLQLASELDLHRLIQTFGKAARQIIGARYSITAILDTDGKRIQSLFTSGMDAETAARLGSQDPDSPPLKSILLDRRSDRLTNPTGDPAALGFSSSHPPVHAWLCAPIVSPTRVYGYISLIDKIGVEEFSGEDERLATILAAQVGRIYQNGSLYSDALRHAADLEREISAWRQQEDRHRQAQQRMAKVVVSSPAVLFTISIAQEQFEISWISDNLLDVMGYAPQDAIGADWWLAHVHPDDRDRAVDLTREALFSRGQSSQEYRFQHGDGSYRWIKSDMRLIPDENGSPPEVVGAWSDITGLKRAEEERRKLREQLQQIQKGAGDPG